MLLRVTRLRVTGHALLVLPWVGESGKQSRVTCGQVTPMKGKLKEAPKRSIEVSA